MSPSADLRIVRAEDALPTVEAARDCGIDCEVEFARDLHVLISRVFAHGESKGRNALYDAFSLIAPAISSEVASDDELLPALLPPLKLAIPVGKSALKAIGATADEIGEAWSKRPQIVRASFPLKVTTTVVPPEAWPYLERFLVAGPGAAEARLGEAIRRRAADLAVGSLCHRIVQAWLVMRQIKEFRADIESANERRRQAGRLELPLSPELRSWSWVPTAPSRKMLVKMGASTEKRDTSAVPVQAIREGLKKYAAATHWGKWQAASWPVGVCFMALKRLVTLVLLVTVSPRIDHLHRLDVEDFAWHRFEDGEEAWGLRFRGEDMKMRDASQIYWKKLPPEVGEIIHAWIVCSGRELGQSDASLLVGRRPKAQGDPGKRYTEGGLSVFISGNPPSRNTGYRHGNLPLIPFPGSEWKGYQAHRYRSFVLQHVEHLVHGWKLQHPENPLSGVDQKNFGDLLLDHGTGDMGYRDFDSKLRYEQIVALGIELLWDSVWGAGAKRKGLDVDRIIDAGHTVQLHEATHQALQHEIEQYEYQKDALKKRKVDLFAKARNLTGEQREDLRLEIDILQNGVDDLSDRITSTLRRQLEVTQDLEASRHELEAARTTQVELPDALSDELYRQRLAAALNQSEAKRLTPEGPKADELLPHDVADLLCVSGQTIWRWRTRQGNLPNPRPFDPDAWIKYDEKDFRLPVTALNLAAIPSAEPEAALDGVRRKRAALGFSKRSTNVPANVDASICLPPKQATAPESDKCAAEPTPPQAPASSQQDEQTPETDDNSPVTVKLLSLMSDRRIWTHGQLLSALTASNPDAAPGLQATIYTALHRLKKTGAVRHVSRGQYQLAPVPEDVDLPEGPELQPAVAA